MQQLFLSISNKYFQQQQKTPLVASPSNGDGALKREQKRQNSTSKNCTLESSVPVQW